MLAYKGFNFDLKCRDFQYAEGKEYSIGDQKPIRCGAVGFHSCEHPLDVFKFYAPATSLYHEVEADGDIDRNDEDTKISSSKIKIGARLSLSALCDKACKYIAEKCIKAKRKHATGNGSAASATGDRSAASATGYGSAASATGNGSAASATGDRSAASATGYGSAALVTSTESSAFIASDGITPVNATAIALGPNSKVKAPAGCWLVCAEWKENKLSTVKSMRVDGKKIKANTWYTVKNGKWRVAE
jgi:hypothetical protein